MLGQKLGMGWSQVKFFVKKLSCTPPHSSMRFKQGNFWVSITKTIPIESSWTRQCKKSESMILVNGNQK